MTVSQEEITSFVDYVYEFYGPDGIYPMGATKEQIMVATGIRLATSTVPFDGDSFDREQVRDILHNMMGLAYATA